MQLKMFLLTVKIRKKFSFFNFYILHPLQLRPEEYLHRLANQIALAIPNGQEITTEVFYSNNGQFCE